METNIVHQGDCLEIMKRIPDNTISTILTDPPYGIKFMGKNWDHGIPGVAFWEEMLRVAKSGATLMAFGGTRTHHRLMVAIEDAGWEIRDCMMWLYAQGFPKSYDVSKAIDKAEGVEREVVKYDPLKARPNKENYAKRSDRQPTSGAAIGWKDNGATITVPSTSLAKQFDGYGTALKPAWEPIIVAQKPIEGTYANNAEVWGVAGLNIDGGRVGVIPDKGDGWRPNLRGKVYPHKDKAIFPNIDGGVGLSQPHNKGRFPANLILSHSEGCVLRGVKRVKSSGMQIGTSKSRFSPGIFGGSYGTIRSDGYANPDGYETTEDWDCESDCVVRLLDEQSGESISRGGFPKNLGNDRLPWKGSIGPTTGGLGDKGGASRFFKNFPPTRFIYSGKAGKKERNIGLERMEKKVNHSAYGEFEGTPEHVSNNGSPRSNFHPTVKPLKVLEYLCILTRTPTGGIVLDPFAGSGTTALAAIATDRPYILIEKEAEYVEIAKQRISGYTAETIYPSEAEEEAGQLTLW